MDAKFPAFVGGYGSGKTQCKLVRALADKFESPDSRIALYDPTYMDASTNTIPRLLAMLDTMPITYTYNRAEKRIDIDGFGQFIFRSMDNPETIVGYEVHRSHVDELDVLKQDKADIAWKKIISRNRQKVASGAPNQTRAYTTPEGFRFVYSRWKRNGGGDYQMVQAATTSNPHLPHDYVETLRNSYPAALLDAYLLGEFVNMASGSVFHCYDRRRHQSVETIKRGEPLHIGMDFNVTRMCAVVHVLRDNGPHAVAELAGVYDTPAMIELIKDRFRGHHIFAYPDASGNAKKSVNASSSDIILLKQAGFVVRAKPSNPSVKDRITATNILFERGKYWVNSDACPQYAESLEQLAYDKNGQPDKASGHDHAADAGTYFISYTHPAKGRPLPAPKYWK